MLLRALVLSGFSFFTLTLPPDDAVAQSSAIDSVRALLDADKDEAALAFARSAVEARPQEAAAHCAQALALNAAGELEAAIESADRCVQLSPEVSGHQYILGESLMELAGDRGGLGALAPAKRGKEAVEKAIELDPENLDARQQLFFFHLSAPPIAGGSKEEAARQAEEIAARDAAMGVYMRYRVQVEDADDQALTAFFNEALPLIGTAADSVGYAVATAASAAANAKEEALSEQLVSKLYAAHSSDPRVSYARARLWTIQGRSLDKAEELLLAFIAAPDRPAFSPSTAGAHWRLGMVFEKQGRKQEALEQYRAALALAPDFQQAQDDLQRLEKELAGG